MSDVTEAPTQDAIAESLLSATEQAPEQQPVAEQAPPEEAEAQPTETEQAIEPEQESAEDWLPSDQDKVFPDEVIERYGQRYNLSAELMQDPIVRQLLHDKINSDIFIQQQKQTEQQEAEPEAAEPTPDTPQLSREQYFQNLDRVIAERTDPEVAKTFHKEFMSVWQLPEAQQPMAFTGLMSKYALNLMNTFMDDMLGSRIQNQISQAFPGFGEMYEQSAYARAWDQVRNENPKFANLPAYGTKEFSKTLRDAAARIPGFDEMQFTDSKGKPLPAMQNAAKKYSMLAQMASGQNVDPQMLQKAAAAGAKNARRAEVRRSAANLGSGQSKGASGASGSSKFQTNQDIFDDEAMDLVHRNHGRL